MDELIFFAVIIFFSVVESIARSRKKKKAGAEAPGDSLPGLPDLPEWEQPRSEGASSRPELPTYDADPSYDDQYQPRSRQDRAREGGSRGGRMAQPPARSDGGAARPSSEEMLPGDLLEELSRMAGRLQQQEARPIEIPKESPPLPEPVAHREDARERTPSRPTAPSLSRLPVRAPRSVPDRAQHRVHEAHAGYGTDPSSRPKSFHDTLDPLAVQLSEDAKAARSLLRSRDTSALRQAFILREVLGEPLGMRE